MKSVLISIQPKWCELIARGKKTVEVRKTRTKVKGPFKCYIYCTQGKDVLAISQYDDKSAFLWKKSDVDRYNADMVRNGKVIGEFVCQAILNYECEFVDDDCYEEIASVTLDEDDGTEYGFIEWSNDGDVLYEDTFFYKTSHVGYEELKKYMGVGFGKFYGWHISDLVIYEHPKELSEFFIYCGDNPKCDGCEAHYYSNTECGKEEYCCSVVDGCRPLKRPPQSWCYVDHPTEKGGVQE